LAGLERREGWVVYLTPVALPGTMSREGRVHYHEIKLLMPDAPEEVSHLLFAPPASGVCSCLKNVERGLCAQQIKGPDAGPIITSPVGHRQETFTLERRVRE